MNYKKLIEKIVKILKKEGVIRNFDWGYDDDNNKILYILTEKALYSFEGKKNKKSIKITIDNFED